MNLKEQLQEEIDEINHMINILLGMQNYTKYLWLVSKLRTCKQNLQNIIKQNDNSNTI